jgi:hypothetical protein
MCKTLSIVTELAPAGKGDLNVKVCLNPRRIRSVIWVLPAPSSMEVLGERVRRVMDSVLVEERTNGRLASCPAGSQL